MITYIVSGHMRTGTSMMMRCLAAASDLYPVFTSKKDGLNRHYGDKLYQPNKYGFWEPAMVQFGEKDFPRQYEGRLLKVLHNGLKKFCPDLSYRVAFMMRDAEEIRQSYEGFFGSEIPPNFADWYYPEMEKVIKDSREQDMDVMVLQMRDVVFHPVREFTRLRDAGWPIDPEVAAENVDESQYRFRKERLTVGA